MVDRHSNAALGMPRRKEAGRGSGTQDVLMREPWLSTKGVSVLCRSQVSHGGIGWEEMGVASAASRMRRCQGKESHLRMPRCAPLTKEAAARAELTRWGWA